MSFGLWRKRRQSMGWVLVVLVLGAVLACHAPTVSADHTQAHPGHAHQASSMPDGLCVTAVLTSVVLFSFSLSFSLFHTVVPWLRGAVPVFPPFIPPRRLVD